MKKVLMIAYHYPPIQGSSGYLRTLKFTRYLPDFGWQPIVISVQPRAYPAISNDQLKEIPASVKVHRCFALDTQKHLAIAGRYPRALALPDRWWTWRLAAVPLAKRIIKEENIDALWTTYPIATAMDIGNRVKQATGIPWVADFRDSMTEDEYPPDPHQRAIYRSIEAAAVMHADTCVFTAPSTLAMYEARYPAARKKYWQVILNGYDEENFSHIAPAKPGGETNKLRLVHAGILYPEERDPRPFFQALAALKQNGIVSRENLEVTLRATGHDDAYRPILEELGISDIVTLAPSVAYEKALTEMIECDGLLLFQAANCNHQIPAKAYEYLRAGRPILALTDAQGDTAKILADAGIKTILDIASKDDIQQKLATFISNPEHTGFQANGETLHKYSRRSQAEELAQLLEKSVLTHDTTTLGTER